MQAEQRLTIRRKPDVVRVVLRLTSLPIYWHVLVTVLRKQSLLFIRLAANASPSGVAERTSESGELPSTLAGALQARTVLNDNVSSIMLSVGGGALVAPFIRFSRLFHLWGILVPHRIALESTGADLGYPGVLFESASRSIETFRVLCFGHLL